jgi:predicted ATPase/DNA-binding CsgD family transcriptional regulator
VTPREVEVLRLVGDRLSNREIAALLHLSERTVESHVSALLRKLAAPDRLALVRAAASVAAGPPRTPLPRPLSSFVGREKEVDELRSLLPRHRLLTLVGPAGCGKTRLALEAVRELAGTPVPVLVDLAPVPPRSDVVQAFADALGVAGRTTDLRDRLRQLLGEGSHRLVVDDCEHVVGPVAELLGDLLASAAGLHVLATSRQPLLVPGEVVHELAPLPVPADTDDPAAVLDAAAGRLFADRGAAALPGFAVTAGNARAVATLCRRLDGLPLALELAAARLRVFSPAELLARLGDRLEVLADGPPGAAGRHRTLATALAWSHDLLDDDERLLLERCAVFPGGFDYDTLVDVVAQPPLDRARVARLFPRLLDRSLVSASRDGSSTVYRLLDSVRHFALERLTARGAVGEARERHARTHLATAAALGPALRGAGQGAALRWLDQRWPDCRIAVRWAMAEGHEALVRRLVTGIGTAWESAGVREDLFEWLDELAGRNGPDGPPGVQDHVTRAVLLCFRDVGEALAAARDAATTASTGTPHDRALARLALGWAYAQARDPRAGATLQQAAEQLEATGDGWHHAFAVQGRGDAEEDADTAVAHLARAAALFGALADDVKRANCLSQMALRSIDAGQSTAEARVWLDEAGRLADRAGSRHERLHADLFRARLDQFRGEPSGAEFARLLAEFRRLGDRRCTARSLLGAGEAALAEGDRRSARVLLTECAQVARATGEATDATRALRLLADAADGEG